MYRDKNESDEPKFIVDTMLGNVARWLRMLGYDTLYDRKYEDWKILDIARKEGRIIITRDRGLHHRALNNGIKSIYLDMDEVSERLAYIAYVAGIRLHIDMDKSRCPLCNGELRKAKKKEVEGKVPRKVYLLHDDFWICTRCGKIYWIGSHWRKIEEILSEARKKYEAIKRSMGRKIVR
ncbi:protein of unknown function DUF82 [Staphylothermus marinus F1]|uniref:Mut7-C RNAse domain-containing protein n=1 Tax=Staphylothermus marinus (strain ATCC 43588 / DSM 3639 / JCM 9404 / F1) TaxID=399550 RepID=A3DP39_STAMF|nr:Mut7-C RNAse domain-containing protein [Staphylothermus marinus]ABN70399.1 protein of unknown function DUF82 [Staphylothermus marinus F1]